MWLICVGLISALSWSLDAKDSQQNAHIYCYDCHYDPDTEKEASYSYQGGLPGYPKCAMDGTVDSNSIDKWPCNSGKCFIRRDPNGLVYRGCADPWNLPWGVDNSINCEYQGQKPSLWWFCEGSQCNGGSFGSSDICADTSDSSLDENDDTYEETVHGTGESYPGDNGGYGQDVNGKSYKQQGETYEPESKVYDEEGSQVTEYVPKGNDNSKKGKGHGGVDVYGIYTAEVAPIYPKKSLQHFPYNHWRLPYNYYHGKRDASYGKSPKQSYGNMNGNQYGKSQSPSKLGFKSVDPPKQPSYKSEPPKQPSYKSEPPQKQSYKSEPPKKSSYKSEPPKIQSYKTEPPKKQSYKSEPPKKQSYKSEPPKKQSYKFEPPKKQSYKSEPPKTSSYKSEPPKQSYKSDPPKQLSYKSETPKQLSHKSLDVPKQPSQKSDPPKQPSHKSFSSPKQPSYKSYNPPKKSGYSQPNQKSMNQPSYKSAPHKSVDPPKQPSYKSYNPPQKSSYSQPNQKSVKQSLYKSVPVPVVYKSFMPPVVPVYKSMSQGKSVPSIGKKSYPPKSQNAYQPPQEDYSASKQDIPQKTITQPIDHVHGLFMKEQAEKAAEEYDELYGNQYAGIYDTKTEYDEDVNSGYNSVAVDEVYRPDEPYYQQQPVHSSDSKSGYETDDEEFGFNQYDGKYEQDNEDYGTTNPCDSKCKGNPSGLFAHPDKSDWFIQCGNGMEAGKTCSCCKPYYLQCPTKTSFNEKTRVCSEALGESYGENSVELKYRYVEY